MPVKVYVIESLKLPGETYTGKTEREDVQFRLDEHNRGRSPYTSNMRPWKLVLDITFQEVAVGEAFEKYLKTGSGRAFMKKHLLSNPH